MKELIKEPNKEPIKEIKRDRLLIDFDGVIANTIRSIVHLYNLDFGSHKEYKKVNWTDINSWHFDELNLTTREHINTYFEDDRFFEHLNFMENAREVISLLSKYYDIYIVTMGTPKNLSMKEHWLNYNLPCISGFIGVNLNEYKDKSHIDMSDAIGFIDDSANNLITSNCDTKILYGDIYTWNEDYDGLRLYNWYDIARYYSDR